VDGVIQIMADGDTQAMVDGVIQVIIVGVIQTMPITIITVIVQAEGALHTQTEQMTLEIAMAADIHNPKQL